MPHRENFGLPLSWRFGVPFRLGFARLANGLQGTMDEHTKQLLLLGREHYQKREFEKAEALLRQVLDKNDRLADVHDMLGVVCHTRGNFAQAEHHFERALAINPSYTEAALNLAVTYNDRGKYEAAREVYAQIQATPNAGKLGLDP